METFFIFPLLKVSSDSPALTATRRLVRDNLHLKARGVTLGSLRMRTNTQATTPKKHKTVPRRKTAKLILAGGTSQDQLRNEKKSQIFGALMMMSSSCTIAILGLSFTLLIQLLFQYP